MAQRRTKAKNISNEDNKTHLTTTKLSVSMRTINNNLQILSKFSKKQEEFLNKQRVNKESAQNVDQENTLTPIESQRLIETTLKAICDLELFEKKLNLKPLDLEKALLNLIKKMLDFSLYREAIEPLIKLRSRLSIYFGMRPIINSYRSQNGTRRPLKNNIGTAVVKDSKFTKNSENLKATKDLKHIYSELCVFPIPENNDTINPEAKLLVLSNLILPKLLKDNGNPIFWAYAMKDDDSILVSSHLEALMRVISRICGKLQNLTTDASTDILRFRAVSIKAFTLTNRFDLSSLLDYILNSAIQCEKTMTNNGSPVNYREIFAFHEEMANILEEHIYLAIQNLKFFKWLDHFSRVARMVNGYAKNIIMHEKIICYLSKKNIPEAISAQLIALKIRVASFVLEELLIADYETDHTSRLKSTRNALSHFSKNLKEDRPIGEKVRMISQFFQSAELLRRPLIKIIELVEDTFRNKVKGISKMENSFFLNLIQRSQTLHSLHSKESTFKMIEEFTQEITLCLTSVCIEYFSEYKDYYLNGKEQEYLLHPDRISLVSIDTNDLLSRLASPFFELQSPNKCYRYIERALQIAQYTSCIEGLRTISNSYYRIGVYYYNDNQIRVAIDPVLKSCEILDRYMHELQQVESSSEKDIEEIRAQLSKRFEVLGICWNLLGEVRNARDAFEKSLKNLPRTEFLKFAKLVSSQGVHSVSQQAPIIPKLIERYVKLTSIVCPDEEFFPVHEVLLDCGFDGIILAGLFEFELRVLKSFDDRLDSSNIELVIYEKLLEWYDGVNFPIRRARVLIEESKITSYKKIGSGKTAVELVEEALDLLKTDCLGQDLDLVHLRSYYLATAYSWMGILTFESESCTSESFKRALSMWKGILVGVPSHLGDKFASQSHIENAQKNIDDVERFYGHLQMLADYFALFDQPINQILTLKLMLKINKSVSLYTQIGKIYLFLGYTGKAGLAFSRAENFLGSHRCTDNVKLSWMLGYSYYLCMIGNMEKSYIIFNKTMTVAESRNVQLNPRNRKHEQLLLAEAYLTRSSIAICLGYLEDAIESCTESLRVFNRLMKNIDRNSRNVPDRSVIETNPFLEERVSTDNQRDKSKETLFDEFLTLSAQRWKWRVSQKLLDCYNKLGRLHILRGCVKEAEYMFKQALLLIDAVRAKPTTIHFLLNIAELEYRRHCWKESEDKLSKVSEYQQKVQVFLKEAAKVKLCLGDFKRYEGDFKCRQGDLEYQAQCYDSAINSYQHANEILSEIMKDEFISKIEQIDSNVFQTPRGRKFVSNLTSTPNSRESNEDPIQFECILLSQMKSELHRRQGWLVSKRGNIEEGLKLIELGRISTHSCLEKAEYLLLLSKIQIMKISSALIKQNRLVFDNAQDSVLSLPLTKRNSRKINRSSKTDVPLKLLEEIDKAVDYLTDAYDLIYECGPTQILQEVGLCIAMAHMIKIYGQNQSNVDQIKIVSICCFYLEMTKALTAKREMVSALNAKLKPSLLYNDTQWPPQFTNSSSSDDIRASKETEIFDEETMLRMEFMKTLSDKYKNERLLTYDKFLPEFSDILPCNWTVCSISIDIETNDMYVCRYRQKTMPLLLRLPLKRQSSREGDTESFSYDDAIGEFKEILELSNQSMRAGKDYQTKQEKLKWWKERKQLDERMKNLLDNIEDCWFGGFKGVLMAH
ncbi:11386_t:CDS:10, partial [Acaulospora morrowiae]